MEAVAEFEEAVRINPYHMIASSNLVIIYLHRLGYLDSAIEICKRQIAIDPQYEWAYCNMGWAYLGKDDPKQAQAAFEKALKINPRNTVNLWRLTHAQRVQGRYQQALKSLEKTLEINQANPAAHYNLGVLHQLLGNTNTALKHFEIFLREAEGWVRDDPTNGHHYIRLALVLARMGEKERSLFLGGKAMAMAPCNVTEPLIGQIDMWGGFVSLCDFDYALLLAVQGRRQEAIDRLELAIRRGYRSYIFMKIHPDLQSLHDEPRFQELMDRVLR
jgi:tetratricopeptide (TPR) repeat protein